MEQQQEGQAAAMEELREYTGGCHCRGVRFRVTAPAHLVAWDCNCSICTMKRNTHFVVPAANFELTEGEELLTTYTFNTHTAKHKFCSRCGVQCFYIPRSNPDGFAVTLWCVDSGQVQSHEIRKFDGTNWEQFIDQSGIQEFSKSTAT